MWPDRETTEELLREVSDGHPSAVNQLFDQHRESLRRMVSMRLDRALTRRVDASDIVQDVFVEANGRLADYLTDPRMPFHLWLRQLAQDRIIDMHRRHREAQRRSIDREQPIVQAAGGADSEYMLPLIDHELTPAAATIRKEMEARFLSAMQLMEEADREVLFMRHFEHLGNAEVADALGISTAAAGMRHLRALRRLRSLLNQEEN